MIDNRSHAQSFAFRSMKTIGLASIVLMLASLIGCNSSIDIDYSAQAQELFTLTNNERTSRSLAALTWNNTLAETARKHAQDMADRDYFSHTNPEGDAVGDRATDEGYVWLMIGENLAMGQPTADDVIDSWMASTGHRENILLPGFTEMGIGVAANAAGTRYWVQVFGTARQ